MEVVFEKMITLHNKSSQDRVQSCLEDELCSPAYMLQEVLMPLAEIEEELEELFDKIESEGLWGEDAPHANWYINLQQDQLTIIISHGDDVDKQVQALHN